MNIILHTIKECTLTQFSENTIYDIDNINIYANSIIEHVPIQLTLEYGGDAMVTPYRYTCALSDTGNTYGNYKIFQIEQAPYFSSRAYRVKITFSDSENSTLTLGSLIYCENLTDTSEAQIQVQGRTLQVGSADIQLLRDDSRSQQLTFQINKNYDNITAFDASKQVQIDYIPADGMNEKEIANGCNFYSDLCSDIKESEDGASIFIYWTVPATATRAEGNLRIALAIVDAPGHESGKPYVWQTSPLSLSVLPNLAARGAIFYSETENSSQISNLQSQIDSLTTTIANIKRVSIDSENGTITLQTPDITDDNEDVYSILDLVEEAADEKDIEVIIGDFGFDEEEEQNDNIKYDL